MTSTSEQPSEKSLELAREFIDGLDVVDLDDDRTFGRLATLLDSRFKDGLKRAAEIAGKRADCLDAEGNALIGTGRKYRPLKSCATELYAISRAILKEAGTP